MTDLDLALAALRQRLDETRLRLERRGHSDRDALLIQAINDGTATKPEVDRYAKLLAPHVRAQLIRSGAWRQEDRRSGNPLPFVPTSAMEVAVEICSYGPDEPAPEELENTLRLAATTPSTRHSRYESRGWEHLCFVWWVEAIVIHQASGGTNCMAIRTVIDEWPVAGPPPAESLLLADERAIALAAPIPSGFGQCAYRIVSPNGMPWA